MEYVGVDQRLGEAIDCVNFVRPQTFPGKHSAGEDFPIRSLI